MARMKLELEREVTRMNEQLLTLQAELVCKHISYAVPSHPSSNFLFSLSPLFLLLSPSSRLPLSILSLCVQSASKESLQELAEEKARLESQLAALGRNLASVRQQFEGEKRRGQEMERRGRSQETHIEGAPTMYIG